jgi:hypothetical protein
MPHLLSVTLPDGVSSGQTIHVQAPDGRLNAIIVPPGMGPGSTFTVEFAPPETAATASPYSEQMQSKYSPSASSQGYAAVPPAPATGGDDGFASGFGNNNFRPPTANAVPANQMHGNYPTTSATLY